MFEKRKLEPVRAELHRLIKKFPRLAGAVISSGFINRGRKKIAAFAKTKEISKQLAEELGNGGSLQYRYDLDGTLTVTLTFGYAKGSDEYEIVKEIFYDDVVDGIADGLEYCFNHLELKTYTDEPVCDYIYTFNNVQRDEIAEAVMPLYYDMENSLDILWETFEEEFGLGESDDEDLDEE